MDHKPDPMQGVDVNSLTTIEQVTAWLIFRSRPWHGIPEQDVPLALKRAVEISREKPHSS